MIRLTSKNDINGVPFSKCKGLKCIYDESSEAEALLVTEAKMKPVVQTIQNMLSNIIPNMAKSDDEEDVTMLVVANEDYEVSGYGSICLFFPSVMDRIELEIGDFYALPCSIHEWIVVERDPELLDGLREIVRQVNAGGVLNENEVLSDEVFEYVNGEFKVAR